MALRYAPAIYPAFASSRIKRARLAKVRLMRADRAIAAKEARERTNAMAFEVEHPDIHGWVIANSAASPFAWNLLKAVHRSGRITELQIMRVEQMIAKAKPTVPDVWHEWRVWPPPDPDMVIELRRGDVPYDGVVTPRHLGQLFNIHDVWWREAR